MEARSCLNLLNTLQSTVVYGVTAIDLSFAGGIKNYEQWLRNAANDGNVFAMQRLGVCLIRGEWIGRDEEEGRRWLTQSAESGNPCAMERLAAALFEIEESALYSICPEYWLNRASELGYCKAAIALGSSLMTGRGIHHDRVRGRDWLTKASIEGSHLAHIKLASHLLSDRSCHRETKEGLSWLRRIGAVEPPDVCFAGVSLYLQSTHAFSREARWLAVDAAILFAEALYEGYLPAKLNLAYLIRRGEIESAPWPSLDDLLLDHLHLHVSFAMVNQALRLARGVQCNVDWRAADELISALDDIDQAFNWWCARCADGDPEGHLVVAWIVRHRLAVDPEHLPFVERLKWARKAGWQVPEWMGEEISRS